MKKTVGHEDRAPKIYNLVDKSVEYYHHPMKQKSRNWNRSKWLYDYRITRDYKKLLIDGKPVHPQMIFEVVRQFWISFFKFLENGNTVTVEWLGRFVLNRTYDEKERKMKRSFLWINKPHPYIKLGISQHYYKTFLK